MKKKYHSLAERCSIDMLTMPIKINFLYNMRNSMSHTKLNAVVTLIKELTTFFTTILNGNKVLGENQTLQFLMQSTPSFLTPNILQTDHIPWQHYSPS